MGLVSWSVNASTLPGTHISPIFSAEENSLQQIETDTPPEFEDVNTVARAITVFVGQNIETQEALEEAA